MPSLTTPIIDSKKRAIIIVAILTIQLIISLVVLFLQDAPVFSADTPSYTDTARFMLSNGFFSQDGINPEYFRTPGYPLFLSAVLAVTDNLYVACIIQVILVLGATYLIYKTVLLITRNYQLSILAMMLFCLEINIYIFAAFILTEILFMFLISLSMYLLCLWRQNPDKLTLFIGMTLSIMASLLVKPAMMYLAMLIIPALIVAVCLKKVKIKHMLIYTLMFAVVFGGWSFRNYVHSGHFFYSTVRHVQLYYYDARFVMMEVDGITSDEAKVVLEQMFEEALDGRTDLDEIEIGLLRQSIGSEYVFSNIPAYIRLNIEGLARQIYGPGESRIGLMFNNAILSRIVMFGISGFMILLCLFYATGFIINLIKKKLTFVDVVLLLSIGYLAAGHAPVGYSRYRLTFYPLLIAGCAILWKDVFEQKVTSRFHKKASQVTPI